VLSALSFGVPVLAAGKLESKADANARLDYHGYGVDLRSERPSAKQIQRGLRRVLGNSAMRARVAELRRELNEYRPMEIIERVLAADGIAPPQKRAQAREAG
jgi:UDP:flavonoid glycosyltransferase YjiC (YdhE family)